MDADEAIQAWLDSPPHRENMLDPTWREVGIGSLHAASAGGTFGGGPTWVITMDFGARTGGHGREAAPPCTKAVAQAQAGREEPTRQATPKNARSRPPVKTDAGRRRPR